MIVLACPRCQSRMRYVEDQGNGGLLYKCDQCGKYEWLYESQRSLPHMSLWAKQMKKIITQLSDPIQAVLDADDDW